MTVTLLDLVMAVSEVSRAQKEVIATVVHLVNSGTVTLCGNLREARLDCDAEGLREVPA